MLRSRINKTSMLIQQKLRDAVMLNTGQTKQHKHLLLSMVLAHCKAVTYVCTCGALTSVASLYKSQE